MCAKCLWADWGTIPDSARPDHHGPAGRLERESWVQTPGALFMATEQSGESHTDGTSFYYPSECSRVFVVSGIKAHFSLTWDQLSVPSFPRYVRSASWPASVPLFPHLAFQKIIPEEECSLPASHRAGPGVPVWSGDSLPSPLCCPHPSPSSCDEKQVHWESRLRRNSAQENAELQTSW